MILTTVGTHNVGFNRLVTAVDRLAATWDEEFVIQRGSSSYEPRNATHFQWASSEQMEQLTAVARVLITHAAAGAIILGLQKQTPLIVVPRMQMHGESMDDHQLQLAKALSEQGRAISISTPTETSLREALSRINTNQSGIYENRQLVNALRKQLIGWETEIKRI